MQFKASNDLADYANRYSHIIFIDKLTNEHEVLAMDEFSHVDFYYKPEAVKASTDAVAEFLNK